MTTATTTTGTTATSGGSSSNSTRLLFALTLIFSILLRVLIGYQHHSGEGNHHGSRVSYGGDYEAQRHWMELTVNLSAGQWYFYDLEYWGLDYPPLTAYVSYACGKLSQWLCGNESMEFETSRGYEDPTHKAFMRGTVLVLDYLFYGTALYCFSFSNHNTPIHIGSNKNNNHHHNESLLLFLFTMIQPSVLLIDHGHFQYNTVSLGLSLWSIYYIAKIIVVEDNIKKFHAASCVSGSFFFVLALNFKQMTLYYSPIIFFYCFGLCFRHNNNTNKNHANNNNTFHIHRFLCLGITVIITFVLLWYPIVAGSNNDNNATGDGNNYTTTMLTMKDRILHILHRIFPFQRGLFEGKVSNIWCALSIKPFNIRQRTPANQQPILATLLTLLFIMPACHKLFKIGMYGSTTKNADGNNNNNNNMKQTKNNNNYNNNNNDSKNNSRELVALLLGTTNTALAFFLCSFQVHEKTILLPLAPMSLLYLYKNDYKDIVFFFSILSTWTLFPLLIVDRLQIAYFTIMLIFLATLRLYHSYYYEFYSDAAATTTEEDEQTTEPNNMKIKVPQKRIQKYLLNLGYFIMIVLHVLQILVEPPTTRYPDIFPVLWSFFGCCMVFCVYLHTTFQLITLEYNYPTTTATSMSKVKSE